ncbi:alpha-hydroxy acid oxidase [Novosphingobium sp. JCM 18896]|uniref:alpha-hydroxy acid oxidase n=1 Tax=Novosphingobium sp. JCM 18896 TaxID=2989731 RepID=UPI00222163F5|nr:alpha-hydroxy acid oxidase [Novosphingobium sp. JCM 18896]MCW1432326.1 alpha-hydroxy-acid oxidizing protein [Novosphingobium sp. JCM 18896]
MSNPARCVNVADFKALARRQLPRPLFDYIEGGADDEVTCRSNIGAYDRFELVPGFLRDVRNIDLSRKVLGCELSMPLILAPTGMTRLFHPGGELAVASEAARAGVGYALSTMATTSIEAVAGTGRGPRLYQLYLVNDDGVNREMVERARAAGYDALILTVDCIVAGNRERDLRNGLTVPPKLGLGSLSKFAVKPLWCLRYLASPAFDLPNLSSGKGGDVSTLASYFAANMKLSITWDDVARVANWWNGPLAIKGLQATNDVVKAADAGASAVVLSNHGGRQLDFAPAPIDLLADVVDHLGDRIEVLVDGGIHRGSQIAKALAMGARACLVGRSYLYGVAAMGAPGVRRVIELLRQELERTCGLLGCASVDELGREHLRLAGLPPYFLADRDVPSSPSDSETPLRSISR